MCWIDEREQSEPQVSLLFTQSYSQPALRNHRTKVPCPNDQSPSIHGMTVPTRPTFSINDLIASTSSFIARSSSSLLSSFSLISVRADETCSTEASTFSHCEARLPFISAVSAWRASRIWAASSYFAVRASWATASSLSLGGFKAGKRYFCEEEPERERGRVGEYRCGCEGESDQRGVVSRARD